MAGLSHSITQEGSHFDGQYTLAAESSLQQGNIVNIQQTANQCLTDLRVTDPRHDKKRIQDTKGGLLKDSYVWVLDNPDFCQWRDDQDQRLLWVKGDPGKGKTMLLCGIIDELVATPAQGKLLSYFFCQATDERINTATAVLRGLIFMLLNQAPSLISHVKEKYDRAGKALFQDVNAWQAMSEILTNMLYDSKLQGVCLLVDALDECLTGLEQLLHLIAETSQSTGAKWLVSSRNWLQIEERLHTVAQRLSLEVNEKSVSTAVDSYITFKMSQLSQLKGYRADTASEIRQYLLSNADGTFLWVALVCQELEKTHRWKALQKAKSFPSGLDAFYERMMQQICGAEDAELCRQILALMVTTYRPLSLAESTTFIDECRDLADDLESLQGIIGLCRSFLTIREDTIYFVHQSAKDFLLNKKYKAFNQILPSGIAHQHYIIFLRTVKLWDVVTGQCQQTLEGHSNWVNSVAFSPDGRQLASASDDETVKLWDVVTGQCQQTLEGHSDLVNSVAFSPDGRQLASASNDETVKLWDVATGQCQQTLEGHGYLVNSVAFSPDGRQLVSASSDKTVKLWNIVTGQCQQTLEGHRDSVNSIAFSPDGRQLASASNDQTVKLWDVATGQCQQTLEGHNDLVNSVAFSPDGRQLASASTKTVKLWDIVTGQCQQTLEGHSDWVNSVAFSPDGRQLASTSNDKTIKLWDVATGQCQQTLEGHSNWVNSVAFSPDGRQLASASDDKTVKLWDVVTGQCQQTLEGHSDLVNSVAFSPDGRQLASASNDETVKLWDVVTGQCQQTLEGHSNWVNSVAFSPDGRQLASASDEKTVKLWDIVTGQCQQTLEGHSSLENVFTLTSQKPSQEPCDRYYKLSQHGCTEHCTTPWMDRE
ncbi:hypothetical protein EsH8_X_000030 [Colletotrichum jinshuiense]